MSDDLHKTLKCRPLSLDFNMTNRWARLHMAEGECCDMSGCIELVQRISYGIDYIETYSGNKKDTCYRRVNGKCIVQAV